MSYRKPSPYFPTLQGRGGTAAALQVCNPEGLGPPKAESLGLCLLQSRCCPLSQRRKAAQSKSPLYPPNPGATWAKPGWSSSWFQSATGAVPSEGMLVPSESIWDRWVSCILPDFFSITSGLPGTPGRPGTKGK